MSSVVISGNTSGAITLAAPAVSGTNTATLPAATGTVMVSGNMPAFSYYQSSAQSLSSATWTKLTFTTSEYDTTSGMYASSRFTPTIAGYYQVGAAVGASAVGNNIQLGLYKNGALFKASTQGGTVGNNTMSVAVYCNGSTDYLEIYCNFATAQNTYNLAAYTYFQACMIRSA